MTTTTISRRTLSSALFFFALFFVARTVFVVQVVYYLRVVFVCLLFFFSRSFFSSSSSRFGGFVFFFLIVGLHSPLSPARRRLRRVLSVCRGRSRFEGCFSRKFFFFFFCFFFSTKTEDWRKKWVLLNDVGKNTNHFIETLFLRGAKNTNRQNVCFSSLMTQHRRKNTMTMV